MMLTKEHHHEVMGHIYRNREWGVASLFSFFLNAYCQQSWAIEFKLYCYIFSSSSAHCWLTYLIPQNMNGQILMSVLKAMHFASRTLKPKTTMNSIFIFSILTSFLEASVKLQAFSDASSSSFSFGSTEKVIPLPNTILSVATVFLHSQKNTFLATCLRCIKSEKEIIDTPKDLRMEHHENSTNRWGKKTVFL